ERGRGARPPESPIQGKEEGQHQGVGHKVDEISRRNGRPDRREPSDQFRGRGRRRRHEAEQNDGDENEDDSTQHARQPTPSQNALVLRRLPTRVIVSADINWRFLNDPLRNESAEIFAWLSRESRDAGESFFYCSNP